MQLLEHASDQSPAKVQTSFPPWECKFGFVLPHKHKIIAVFSVPYTAIN
jgi:hypothetical protein